MADENDTPQPEAEEAAKKRKKRTAVKKRKKRRLPIVALAPIVGGDGRWAFFAGMARPAGDAAESTIAIWSVASGAVVGRVRARGLSQCLAAAGGCVVAGREMVEEESDDSDAGIDHSVFQVFSPWPVFKKGPKRRKNNRKKFSRSESLSAFPSALCREA